MASNLADSSIVVTLYSGWQAIIMEVITSMAQYKKVKHMLPHVQSSALIIASLSERQHNMPQ